MNRKEEVIAFAYKVFVIAVQIYNIASREINTLTLITNGALIVYLVFRFYLLLKLSKDAKKMKVPFTEYLTMRCANCDKCKFLNSDTSKVTKS
jgi:hypothetical protein